MQTVISAHLHIAFTPIRSLSSGYCTHSVLTRLRVLAMQGQWIDPELPENLSAEFAKLVMRSPQFLTEAEQVS